MIWITKILKKYSFPVFKNERFVTENVLYYQVSYNKPVKLINDIFYLFEYKINMDILNKGKFCIIKILMDMQYIDYK